MRRLLLFGIPILAIGIVAYRAIRESGAEYATTLYRMAPSDPDKWTPGQRQFDTGIVVLTPDAEQIIFGVENAISSIAGRDVSGMLLQMLVTRHGEGDWGDLETRDPEWAADQDATMAQADPDFYSITGIHNIAGKEVWIKTDTDPAGNVTTLYRPGED